VPSRRTAYRADALGDRSAAVRVTAGACTGGAVRSANCDHAPGTPPRGATTWRATITLCLNAGAGTIDQPYPGWW
jgi:hypothetical protein